MSADACWLASGWPWALAPGLPLLLAALLLVRRMRRVVERLTWVGALPLLALALFAPSGSGVRFDALLFGSGLGIDDPGRPFALLTATVWLAASVYAFAHLRAGRGTGVGGSHGAGRGDRRRGGVDEGGEGGEGGGRTRYFAFHLVTMSGNVGVTVAEDAAGFYLFFALMTFASYGLIVHEGSPEARRAGLVYLVLAVFGEALLAAGIMIALAGGGALGFQAMSGLASSPHGGLGIALLLAGFGVKVGMLPLHVWLPLAHPVAPTPASALLSGSIIAGGLLGWLRMLPIAVAGGTEWAGLCVGIGLMGALGGAVLGTLQRDPKVLLAYSSISQMGWMTIGLGAALASGPADASAAVLAVGFFALHHGLAKAALFLSVGVARQTASHGAQRWLLRLGVVLSALVIAGLPGTSGALAKSRLETLVLAWNEAPDWIGPGLVLGVVGTAALMARFVGLLWSKGPASDPHARPDREATGLWLPWWGLLLVSLALAPVLDGLLPGLFEWLEPGLPRISLAKLAPIAAGALLVLGCSRTRLAEQRVAAGDLLWLLWPGLRAARRASRSLAVIGEGARQRAIAALGSEGHARRIGSGWLQRLEAALEPWTVLAVLMLVSASLLIARSLRP